MYTAPEGGTMMILISVLFVFLPAHILSRVILRPIERAKDQITTTPFLCALDVIEIVVFSILLSQCFAACFEIIMNHLSV